MHRKPVTKLSRSGVAGFALVATMWTLGLITLLGTALIVGARYRATEATASSVMTRASLAAEGAVNLALHLLLEKPHAIQSTIERFPLRCRMPGGEAAFVTIEDEAGKVDLNAASPQLLALLFSRLSGNADAAARIADRIVQFRREHSKKPTVLANFSSNNAVSRLQPFVPASEPAAVGGFVSILQLEQAVELRPSLFRAALPFITVRSGRPDLAPEAASVPLRRLLDLPVALGRTTPRDGRLNFTIRADVATPDGARFIRELAVSFGNNDRPFQVHEWRRGDTDSPLEAVHQANRPMEDCFRSE